MIAKDRPVPPADESAQGDWRSGKVLPPLEHRNRIGDRESRPPRNFSNDSIGRSDRRDIPLPSTEAGVDKWERRGPLPPLEIERRSRTGFSSRSASGQFSTNRSPSTEGPADASDWRSNKPVVSITAPDSMFLLTFYVDVQILPSRRHHRLLRNAES